MLRTNLNIAIVSMVKARPGNNLTLTSECLVPQNDSYLQRTAPDGRNSTNKVFQGNASRVAFPWNEKEQSRVLGAFFWLHWVTQVPGGILGSKYGAKLVFGLANFTAVLCCFFIPMAAFVGHEYLIGLRILQGILAVSCF
jgi:ACS family sodium-dependent inorganic phosphate cotransporter-like MFS transporter 5